MCPHYASIFVMALVMGGRDTVISHLVTQAMFSIIEPTKDLVRGPEEFIKQSEWVAGAGRRSGEGEQRKGNTMAIKQ